MEMMLLSACKDRILPFLEPFIGLFSVYIVSLADMPLLQTSKHVSIHVPSGDFYQADSAHECTHIQISAPLLLSESSEVALLANGEPRGRGILL